MTRFFITILLVGALLAGGFVYWACRDLPDVDQVLNEGVNPAKWTQILAADGEPIQSYTKFRHQSVELDEVSPYFVDALLATEDRRFYEHGGVDLYAIARAVAKDIIHMKLLEGGSTLTQQLARNVFLTHERSFHRKVREAALAMQLEDKLSKEEILTLYMNTIYFGEGAYGIHAASEIYFDKKPSELSVDEAAMLAGLPQAPSRYSPFHNPDGARNRRNEVLHNLLEVKSIDQSQFSKLRELNFKLNPIGRELSNANKAPFYNQQVMQLVLQQYELDEQEFWHSGFKIYTTLDLKAQVYANRAVNQMLGEGKKEGALISIDPKTGAILAYVGGKDYGTSQFDRVIQAKRSSGSLFKVITYTTAIDQGYLPSRVYLDEPIKAGDWEPRNYDGKHHGYMTMARALVKSNNVIAVKVLHELTPPVVIDMARRMGMKAPLENNLSLTLGSSSVTLMDITSTIGVLANGGIRVEPYLIERIVDPQGETVYQHETIEIESVSRQTADTMVTMLQAVVQHGTGQGANIGRPMAGKTGTSDESRDGWFVGFTPEVVTGVWVGHDDNSPVNHLTGGSLPAMIWRDTMRPYLGETMSANFDLAYSLPIEEADFFNYSLANISEYEITTSLALEQGRPLPTAEIQFEQDENIAIGPEIVGPPMPNGYLPQGTTHANPPQQAYTNPNGYGQQRPYPQQQYQQQHPIIQQNPYAQQNAYGQQRQYPVVPQNPVAPRNPQSYGSAPYPQQQPTYQQPKQYPVNPQPYGGSTTPQPQQIQGQTSYQPTQQNSQP